MVVFGERGVLIHVVFECFHDGFGEVLSGDLDEEDAWLLGLSDDHSSHDQIGGEMWWMDQPTKVVQLRLFGGFLEDRLDDPADG